MTVNSMNSDFTLPELMLVSGGELRIRAGAEWEKEELVGDLLNN